MPNPVLYVVADHVATVTLNRPETRNALSDDLLDELLAALENAGRDDDVRVVVLTSSHERIFSAGGDLKPFASNAPVIEKYAGLPDRPAVPTRARVHDRRHPRGVAAFQEKRAPEWSMR